MINIGELRQRITIQEKGLVPDGEGGFVEDWTDKKTVWAKATVVQARQQYEFNSIGVEATHRFEVRGNVKVTEDQRIRFKNRFFEIKTIEDIEERGIRKVITCRELR